MPLDLSRIGVQADHPHPPRLEPLVGAEADPAHAEYHDVRRADRNRLVVRMPLPAFEARNERREPRVDRVRGAIERGGDRERQRHRDRQRHHPALGQQAAGGPGLHHDESELTVVGQREPGQHPAARPELECDEQAVEQRALQGQQGQRHEGQHERLAAGQAGHADEQEEPHQEGFLQSPQCVEQLLRLRVVRKQGAEHQCSKLPAQSERLEAVAAGEREADAEQQEDLPVAGDVEKPVEEAPRRQQREQRNGPRRRRRPLREAEHRDGGEILHDEDPDRDAAVERAKLALLVERLRHHHGAGEPEGARGEQRGDPTGAESVDDEDAEQGGEYREMDERGTPDLGAHDVAQAHLHPHREQHEQHAGVRDGLQTARCGHPGRVEGEARREKADERRHAERAGGEAQDERAGNVDSDHGRPPALRCRRQDVPIIERKCRRFKFCRIGVDRSSRPGANISPIRARISHETANRSHGYPAGSPTRQAMGETFAPGAFASGHAPWRRESRGARNGLPARISSTLNPFSS